MEFEQNQASLWQQDEGLKSLRTRLEMKPEGIRMVSFDFFDTLVSRLCADPADLFVEVGRQLAQHGLLAHPMSPMEFRAARMCADERARNRAAARGRPPEVRLAEIYQEMKQVVTDPVAAHKLEFEVERTFCYLNPAMVSLVRHVRALGCKTCIVSDTYFTTADLAQLLRDNGVSMTLFDHVFASSECGKAKWSGDLYQEMLRHFDLHPSEVIHVGDNPHADIACARPLGIEAVHYYRTTPALDPLLKSERSLAGTNTYPAGSLNSLRVMTARRSVSRQDAFRDGAMVFGPVLGRHADWCVETLRASGVRKVLALMREGELLGELVQRAAAAAGVELEVMTCYVSRMSTARAAISEATAENTMGLLEGFASMTPLAVMEILGMGQEAARFLDPETQNKPANSFEEMKQSVHRMFERPGFRQLAEAKRLESHNLAFDYLTSLIGDDKTVGVIDLGWSGSIQRNVSRILRYGGRKVRTVGCYLACTKRTGRLALDGDIAHAYLEPEWCRSTILAEIAITACVGSTDGYRRNSSGKVEPVLGSFEITPAERAIKGRLREGVLAFQSHWLSLRWAKDRLPLSPETLADLDRNSAAILYRLIEFPSQPEANRLGVLRHDENYFGQSLSAPLCNQESSRRLRQGGVLELFREAQCYWPQGIVAQGFPRLISALRNGWTDVLALGRLGAWHNSASSDPGITDEEMLWLGTLLRGLAVKQVVFFGSLTSTLAEGLRRALPPADGNHVRVIVVGPASDPAAAQELSNQCVHLPISMVGKDLIGSIRQKLSPVGDIAVVLSSDVAESAVRLLLNGLAPFLGQHGVILTASGRFDVASRGEDSTLLGKVNDWFDKSGTEIGYSLWQGPQALLPQMCNWLILRRTPELKPWNRQWMPKIGDLAGCDAQMAGPPLKEPLGPVPSSPQSASAAIGGATGVSENSCTASLL